MLAKNKRPYDAAALPPAARLRNNVRDILGDNLLSTRRVQELATDISQVRDTRFLRSGKDKKGNETQLLLDNDLRCYAMLVLSFFVAIHGSRCS